MDFQKLGNKIYGAINLWIKFHETTKNIHVYEVTTMKLLQLMPFPYFDVRGIKWNQDHSSFTAFDYRRGQYCVIERL